MSKLPSEPDYLPKQEIPKMDWAITFSAALILLGGKYNIAAALIEAVTANTVIISAFLDNFKKAKKFYADLVVNKNVLLLVNPPNPNPEVDLAVLPKFTAWPSAAVASTLLNPHIEAAEILNANAKLTATDRTTLGLDKQPIKPSKRPTAEDFNYPLLTYVVEKNTIKLTIKRGNRWKGKVCQVVMASGEGGPFSLLTITGKQKTEVPVIVPAGKLAATFVFQATYMDGNNTVGDWSPNLVVAVGKPNEPEMAVAA